MPKSNLSAEVVGLLRGSLAKWVRGEATDDASVRSALHAVAAEARDRGVRAEELLVLLKTTWYEVGGVPNPPHGSGAGGNRQLDELVTACIKAYYG